MKPKQGGKRLNSIQNMITITEIFVGSGSGYRKVYHVFRGGKFVCQYSNLDSVIAAYPGATFEPIAH